MPGAVALTAMLVGLTGPHTFDGRHELAKIDLTVVYLVPRGRKPLADWRDRVDYFTRRIAAFHARESSGASVLRVETHGEPLIAGKSPEEIRGKDPNETFSNSIDAASSALKWPPDPPRDGFPILLVLSEINWRELDDFRRTRRVDGEWVFEGNVDEKGRHFPGAESGGSRAVYDADRGVGYGLVSADGWRVPYTGSDCVVYHEGIGHPVGLPHPEPIDGSVMGLAQYKGPISRTWIEEGQKKALGLDPAPPIRKGAAPTDLFSAFDALPDPIVPRPGRGVNLRLEWPKGAKVKELKVRVQTDLRGAWRTIPLEAFDRPPTSVGLGSFDRPTPVSYRVDAKLEGGETAETWGYFQVKDDR